MRAVIFGLLAVAAVCTAQTQKKCACVSVTTKLQATPVAPENATVVEILQPPTCLPYSGRMRASDEGNIWAEVEYRGQKVWMNTDSSYIKDCSETRFACVCGKTSAVLRSCHTDSSLPLRTIGRESCLPYTDNLSADKQWAEVLFQGRDSLRVATFSVGSSNDRVKNFIHAIRPAPVVQADDLHLPECPPIVPRSAWGARDPLPDIGPLPDVPQYLFLHHGATAPCRSTPECVRMLQAYQNFHIDGHGWSDIGYSFVVGEDGRVYEARGWNQIGAHTRGYNTVGYGICVIGNFMQRTPNAAALSAVRALLHCALQSGRVVSDYTLLGHRDVGTTQCPGDQYYNLIQTWPHFNMTRP